MQGRAMAGNGRNLARLDKAACKEVDLNAALGSTVDMQSQAPIDA